MVLVVFRVVRVSRVDPARHEHAERPGLVFRKWFRRHLEAADEAVTIVLFSVSGHGQETSQQGQMPEVDEGYADAGVEAEDPNTWKRRHDAGKKAAEVGKWRHRDGDGRVAEAKSHSFRNWELMGGQTTPGAEQDVGVVEADAQEQKRSGHVQADELDLSVAAEPESGDL